MSNEAAKILFWHEIEATLPADDGNRQILLDRVEGFNAPIADYTLAYTSEEFKL